jgi:hypothetical protein
MIELSRSGKVREWRGDGQVALEEKERERECDKWSSKCNVTLAEREQT